ncbi:DNA sulfur modification protein DndD [Nocardiopsis sp. CNS-639]|uniref:DNA sulfur modification protein DndD n=1 Tax=Nocardiopsis sp. CNS-639 TaxID=1169153 RepID=UPI00056B951A|nr:DNA sulfur modification protein DndD [Nocardiopsis sp. CNS-639]
MLLRKITLKNFGAYLGEQTLELATEPNKPIVLIGGLNGCGKTTLLDAIQLALYGPRARCSGRGNRPYDAYLRESINRQVDPREGTWIRLEFSLAVEGSERHYRVTRRWFLEGNKIREAVGIEIDGSYDPVISSGWADHIEDLLPLEIASLFFFDGEKIESLADTRQAATVIESAVQSLLGINTIRQLRTDLVALEKRNASSKADKETAAKLESMHDELRLREAAVEESLQKRASIQSKVDQARKNLADAERSFEKEGGSYYERRVSLEAERVAIAKQRDSVRQSLIMLASGALPLSLLSKQTWMVLDQVEQEREAVTNAQLLEVLRERDQWLLKSFENEGKASDLGVLAERLAEDRRLREQKSSTEYVYGLTEESYDQLRALPQILSLEQRQASDLTGDMKRLNEKIESLDRQLAGVPAEDVIEKKLKDRDAAIRRVAELEGVLATVNAEYEQCVRQREQTQAALEREHRASIDLLEKTEDAARIIEYSSKIRTTLDQFGKALLERRINGLEVAVLDSFSKLMRKNGLVKDLRIDTAKYNIVLVGEDGEPLEPNRLSAGERQLLAVSLLWGIARVAGNRLPSVIDTPLGRLDSQHREHLVERYFPNASHQVLLLSTDEEIDERLLGMLKPYIAHAYTLTHDDSSLTTTVEPGYWWMMGAAHVS